LTGEAKSSRTASSEAHLADRASKTQTSESAGHIADSAQDQEGCRLNLGAKFHFAGSSPLCGGKGGQTMLGAGEGGIPPGLSLRLNARPKHGALVLLVRGSPAAAIASTTPGNGG